VNKATQQNLARKSHYIDKVQLLHGDPLFSWIDINLTELCNRVCEFCPRADKAKYPNQSLHISYELIKKISQELHQLKYQGAIVFAGFGEPMLHPEIIELLGLFKDIRLEIVTNGDTLSVQQIQELIEGGVDLICISMYDGEHQVEEFKNMFIQAGVNTDYYILRDRWHTKEDEYGLKLTNRAGMVTVGLQDEVRLNTPCYYPHYSMTIDWNGDVLLCVQDWNKKIRLGNIYAQTLLEVWNGSTMKRFRRKLSNCDRNMEPCNQCNAEGTLHGFNHEAEWLK